MDRVTLKMIFSGSNFRKYQYLTKLFSPQEIRSKPQNILYLSLLRELELSTQDISYGSFVEGIKRIRKKLKQQENQLLLEKEKSHAQFTSAEIKQLSPKDNFLQLFPPPSSSLNHDKQESLTIIKTIKDLP